MLETHDCRALDEFKMQPSAREDPAYGSEPDPTKIEIRYQRWLASFSLVSVESSLVYKKGPFARCPELRAHNNLVLQL